ncbi:uncharacterized protein LOC143484421 isoform X3 [Brachyhypopomus gauderio]|uniref:uncharacterized protein LOC143484421 isoform X3 n=1 Tax=Brachyhypopomus gauderio TaxID=698409 RepID=UPI004041C661
MKVFGHAVIVASALTACLAVITQITSVEVPFGGTVSLHCNHGGGDLDLKWEAKGKDVASYLDGQLVVGKGFEERVELSQSEDSEGSFSLTLTDVVMSDAGLYECVWQGRRVLTTVTLNVLSPPFPNARIVVAEGEDVTLPCFGQIPKDQPWEKIHVRWLKNDKVVLFLDSGGSFMHVSSFRLSLSSMEDVTRGNFFLSIKSARVSDQGVYKCLYKDDSETLRSGDPETYALIVTAFETSTPEDTTALLETDVGVTDKTKSSTSMEEPELITPDAISDLPSQATMTSDLVGLITGTSADSATQQSTMEDIPTQATMTSDLVGLIAGSSADIATEQSTMEVFQTFTTEDIRAMMEKDVGVTDKTESGTSMEGPGLIALERKDSTTVQGSGRVISDLPSQATMTSDLVGLIAGTSADSATQQSTTEVISDLLTQATLTSDLVGLIAGTSADSSTEERNMEVFQTSTPEDTTALLETSFGITDKTKSSTSMEEPGLITPDGEDSTTVQGSGRVMSDVPLQARLTSDLVGLIADASADSTTEQESLEGVGNPSEVWKEKVPWVCIGIVGGVILATAVFLGIMVALGKL